MSRSDAAISLSNIDSVFISEITANNLCSVGQPQDGHSSVSSKWSYVAFCICICSSQTPKNFGIEILLSLRFGCLTMGNLEFPQQHSSQFDDGNRTFQNSPFIQPPLFSAISANYFKYSAKKKKEDSSVGSDSCNNTNGSNVYKGLHGKLRVLSNRNRVVI